MTTDTLTSPPAAESLEHALAWRRTALEHLTASRRPLAEALIAMPASVERLGAQQTLAQLDLAISNTRRGVRWAERLMVTGASGA